MSIFGRRAQKAKPKAKARSDKPAARAPARPDTRGEEAVPPFVEAAKKEIAETVLERGNTSMNAALGGFAPTLTTDDIKDDVRAAEKASKEAEGKNIDPEAPDAMAQTAAAHQAALGGFSFAGGTEAVALPKGKTESKSRAERSDKALVNAKD